MDLSSRTVWQQASGEPPRSYADLCLRYGVILNGYDEAWTEDIEAENDSLAEYNSALAEGSPEWLGLLKCSKKRKNDLKRFSQMMQDKDVVVLRRGMSEVFGVGTVVGGLGTNNQFGDVDGWNIPLVRRVRWFWRGTEGPRRFPKELKWGDTTQHLKRSGLLWQWLESLHEPTADESPLPELGDPYGQKHITIDEISEYLFDKGVASAAIRHLVEEIGELVRIAKWYRRVNHSPSEHETVAYLVVPLLNDLTHLN